MGMCRECRVDIGDDGECPSCGVDHSAPCPACGQAGYHAAGCVESDTVMDLEAAKQEERAAQLRLDERIARVRKLMELGCCAEADALAEDLPALLLARNEAERRALVLSIEAVEGEIRRAGGAP